MTGSGGGPGQVFLSYAHQDRGRARILVEALRQQGIEVWWDQDIVTGQNWENEIDHALRGSRGVIVLWSRYSVASEEVKAEANYARGEKKLIPVRLDDAEIPVRYRLTQTVDLSAWDGADEAAAFRELLDDLRVCAVKTAVPVRGADKTAWKAGLVSWAWIVLPTVVIGGLAIGLMVWRAPTELEVEVTCSRLRFRSQAKDQVLLSAARANSILVQGFEEVRLPVSAVEAANPAKWDARQDKYLPEAWVKVSHASSLRFHPAGRNPAQIALQPADKSAEPLVLDRIFTQPAAITLTSPGKSTLNVEFGGRKLSGSISLPETLTVIADDCSVEGAIPPWARPSVTLRVSNPRQDRLLEYSSSDAGVVLVLEFAAGRKDPVVAPSAFPIEQLEFLEQGPAGPPLSSIKADGTIRYRRFPAVQPVPVKAADFLTLEDLRSFYLREVAFTEQENQVRVRLEGVAGKARSGPGAGAMRDLRLTRFDMVWNNQKLVALFTLLGWLVVTSIGLRKYLKEHASMAVDR